MTPPSLQEEQLPLEKRLANALIESTPETWKRIALTVLAPGESGSDSFRHEIRSPEGHAEPIHPSENLKAVTRELLALSQRYGHGWRRLEYLVALEDSGDWVLDLRVTY